MDVFHEDTLVLEDVTLRLLVQGVVAKIERRSTKGDRKGTKNENVQVLIDLSSLSVLL